jgi:hypothetical protein
VSVQPAEPPAARQPAAQPEKDDATERIEKLRAELAMAEAARPPVPGTARVRVAGKHDTFTLAGVTVGPDFTPVPIGALTGLMSAAADAGVTLEEASGA